MTTKDQSHIRLDLSVDVNGRTWDLYECTYDGVDGKFVVYIHAISFEHADALIHDLRDTVRVTGKVEEVLDGKTFR